jgi:hypothetical protein
MTRLPGLVVIVSGQQARDAVALPQTQRVDRRLSAETIAQLVQAYGDGASTTELRRRYELSQGSVIRILHDHDVEMRGQGLADEDVPTAAELYRDGATLAQLGGQFGVSPNAIRRALFSAGVLMRPRGGRKRLPLGGRLGFLWAAIRLPLTTDVGYGLSHPHPKRPRRTAGRA